MAVRLWSVCWPGWALSCRYIPIVKHDPAVIKKPHLRLFGYELFTKPASWEDGYLVSRVLRYCAASASFLSTFLAMLYRRYTTLEALDEFGYFLATISKFFLASL